MISDVRLRTGRPGVDDVEALLQALDAIAARTDATIQAFDARYVISSRHLERARELADRAIERDAAVADDRAVEILLYAAGRRQISDALTMGVTSTAHPVVILVDGGDEAAAVEAIDDLLEESSDPEVLGGDADRIQSFFDITDAELATGADLEALVLERVALLAVNR